MGIRLAPKYPECRVKFIEEDPFSFVDAVAEKLEEHLSNYMSPWEVKEVVNVYRNESWGGTYEDLVETAHKWVTVT